MAKTDWTKVNLATLVNLIGDRNRAKGGCELITRVPLDQYQGFAVGEFLARKGVSDQLRGEFIRRSNVAAEKSTDAIAALKSIGHTGNDKDIFKCFETVALAFNRLLKPAFESMTPAQIQEKSIKLIRLLGDYLANNQGLHETMKQCRLAATNAGNHLE